MDGYLHQDPHFATKACHEGAEPEQWSSMSIVPPICLATSFKQDAPADYKQFEYSRSGNPSRNCLEKCIASLDQAKYAMCFSSGLGATTAITHMLSAGDHLVSMDDLYGGTNRYFSKVVARMNIATTFVDAREPDNVEKAIKPNTKMVWIETPTNPTLKIVDIRAIADVVKRHKDIFLVVDNTFLSSYFQKPLTLGADIVMYSLTKYMNGHADVVMGAVATNREDLSEQLIFLQNSLGPVPSPFDCYLVHRSMKTLALRMKQHMANGLAVGRFLEKHPCVEKVTHPGLPTHPQHALAKRQCSGYSGMVAMWLKGGLTESRAFLKNLKLFILAESLGGYESLAELPSLMTHASVSAKQRAELGISDNLIRLSVGLEDEEDIINDLDQALRAAVKVNSLL